MARVHAKWTVYRTGGVEQREADGRLLAWGTDYEELSSGLGHFPAAIIELDDGSVVVVPAVNIRFLKADQAEAT